MDFHDSTLIGEEPKKSKLILLGLTMWPLLYLGIFILSGTTFVSYSLTRFAMFHLILYFAP